MAFVDTSLTLSVLILAGGHSRRMGRDKALLPLRSNQSLLRRTAQIGLCLSEDVAVVTPWPERYQRELPPGVRLIEEPGDGVGTGADSEGDRIENRPTKAERDQPSAGPLSGLAYGWQQQRLADWCLLLACDMPYLDAEVLRCWWQWIVMMSASHNSQLSGVAASLAQGQKGWEPLCGFYHRRCLPSLLAQVSRAQMAGKSQQLTRQQAKSQRGFQPWLQQLSIAAYDRAPAQMFFNCNTPAEWQRAKSLVNSPLSTRLNN